VFHSQKMETSLFLINLITVVIGVVTLEASFKLINPWHRLYEQFRVVYQQLATFWGIPVRGFLFRLVISYARLLSGIGASLLCWVDYPPWSQVLLAVSISIIITLLVGAVLSEFGRGWEATREPALLLSIAVVSLYLQSCFGQLQSSIGTVFICLFVGGLLVVLFCYMRKQAVESEKQKGTGARVTLLAPGEDVRSDTYYRLA